MGVAMGSDEGGSVMGRAASCHMFKVIPLQIVPPVDGCDIDDLICGGYRRCCRRRCHSCVQVCATVPERLVPHATTMCTIVLASCMFMQFGCLTVLLECIIVALPGSNCNLPCVTRSCAGACAMHLLLLPNC
jgi:hypothetical protein